DLENNLADLSVDILINNIPKWINGQLKAKEQDHSKATYCSLIKKEDGRIDWKNDALKIERKVRAFHKWPVAHSFWDNKRIKILDADVVDINHSAGKVFQNEKGLLVGCGNGSLVLKKVQIEGKKEMSGHDILNGYPSIVGNNLS
ncbi:MAG: methionyl-tRNA formyltransferase, partial [Candidatus Portnoybacteria bacterium]|nr:methionyl-tRNA formyltransferase [Candidatus Portnoybacteria bacterium]